MKYIPSLLLLCIAHATAFTQVAINELLASNAITNTDPDYQAYNDWIELYNAGATAVNLTGWQLSDDNDIPNKWAFPAGTTIDAGGYLLVWADGQSVGLHTNFKLAADGEKVGIDDSIVTYESQEKFTTKVKVVDLTMLKTILNG